MVDQTEVKPADGRTELPPRAVARGTAEFLHDVTTLAELQGKLLVVDLRQGVEKLVMPAVLLVIGVVVGLGAVPIALAALALTIKATTELSLFVTFWIAVAVGVVLSLALALPAYSRLKHGMGMFERSYYEWGRNLKWIKDTLQRLGRSSHSSASYRSPGQQWKPS